MTILELSDMFQYFSHNLYIFGESIFELLDTLLTMNKVLNIQLKFI